MTRLQSILELARWAPSGDNSQPWRFEVRSDRHLVVHAIAPPLGVYDLDGRASLLSVGGLLETLRIAASAEGLGVRTALLPEAGGDLASIDVRLDEVPGLAVDPLHAFVLQRSVQRRPLSTRPLDGPTRSALEASMGGTFQVVWFEGWRQRLRLAWLAVRSAKIRLTIPEAYEVHRRIIEWDARFSDDRIPDQALGTDALSVRSMRWVLDSWPRVQRMNRYFGGTLTPRLQLELLPGVRCAAHFALLADRTLDGTEDHLVAGAAMQRFWLTATRLGLQLQPQHTPLAFAGYVRRGVAFTELESAAARAAEVAGTLARLLGGEDAAERAFFLGRLGHGPAATSRSLRLSLAQLTWSDAPATPTSPPV